MPVIITCISILFAVITCTNCFDRPNQTEYLDYNFNLHGANDYYFKYLTTSSELEFTDVEAKQYRSKCRQDSDCKHSGGTCLKGACVRVCGTETNGSRCAYYHCDGKASFASSDYSGSLIETNGQPLLEHYLSQKKCSWILRNLNSGDYKDVLNENLSAEFSPFIQLEIERFETEFGNDYLYIFAGDSVFSPLVASLSGDGIASDEPSLAADNENNHGTSGKFKINFFNTSSLFLLFKSDIYSPGVASYDVSKPGGVSIKYRFSSSCTDQLITNVANTICYNSINKQLHQTMNNNTPVAHSMATKPVTTVTYFETNGNRVESPLSSRLRRAFHCSFTYKNWHYIVGGYSTLPNNISLISRLNLETLEWHHDVDKSYEPSNRSNRQKFSDLNFVPNEIEQQIPEHRYAHSCVLDEQNSKFFMYGGIKYNHRDTTKPFDTQLTNELWSYDLLTNKWTLINDNTANEKSNNNKNYILPVAVSGHSLALIRNEDRTNSLLIFFGFSEYYGSTVNIIQEFNLVTRSWRLHTTLSHTVNLGFAHTMNHDVVNNQIYFHGGLNINNNLANSSRNSSPVTRKMYNYDLNTKEWTEKPMLIRASFMHSSTLIDNKIITFGGVVYNVDKKTNKTAQNPNISNDLNVFNIDTNKWYTIPASFKHRQRHSHSSFIHDGYLYIFGGFNGFFLNDIFKIDLKLIDEVTASKKKRQIIYPINGSGPIMLQEPLKRPHARKVSRSNSFDKNQLFLGIVELCNIYKSCSSCQSNINCIWNNKQCEYYSASSLSSNVTERVIYKKPTCERMCNEAETCSNCTANADCIWCASESRCLLQNAVKAYFPFGSCIDFVGEASRCEKPVRASNLVHYLRTFDALSTSTYSACQVRYSNCSSCIMDERCGWCSLDSGVKNLGASNTGVGLCMEGSNSKANDDMCGANWFFTQCPSCECNGHSTCSKRNVTNFEQVARTCTNCLNNTRGMNCQECARGFFGNPENNGTCKSCNCGVHSDFCDRQTGRCFCNTKGVVGSRCDRCETPRYTGMPSLPEGSCYYNLSTDYQFTFNLNKAADRFYNRINFVNHIQDDMEDDIDFMIRCFKSDAVFNVTFMVDYDPSLAPSNLDWPFSLFSNITNYIFYKNKTEYVLSIAKNPDQRDEKTERSSLGYYMGNEAMKTLMLAQVNCSEKEFRYTFSNKEFRDKHNSTFLVHVFGFEVPITVQISFSRRSRIQLLHFFITFFGCLFSLLAIAFITWKSKQRYDQYRHQRQVVIQMEHMASRPFTKLLIDVTKIHSEDRPDANLIQHTGENLKAEQHNQCDQKKSKNKLCSRINKKNLLRRSSKNLTNLELHGQHLETSIQNVTNQLPEVMPVAVEPLGNNKTAVLTCVLKLPQGGLSHTPKGSSPIILASTYVAINSSTSFSKPQYDSNTDSIMLDDDDDEALKKNHSQNV